MFTPPLLSPYIDPLDEAEVADSAAAALHLNHKNLLRLTYDLMLKSAPAKYVRHAKKVDVVVLVSQWYLLLMWHTTTMEMLLAASIEFQLTKTLLV